MAAKKKKTNIKTKIKLRGNTVAVPIDGVQVTELRLSTSKQEPYRVALSAKLSTFGESAGERVYEGKDWTLSVPDLAAMVDSHSGAEKTALDKSVRRLLQGLIGVARYQLSGIEQDEPDA
jgi:hypothetical protein